MILPSFSISSIILAQVDFHREKKREISECYHLNNSLFIIEKGIRGEISSDIELNYRGLYRKTQRGRKGGHFTEVTRKFLRS